MPAPLISAEALRGFRLDRGWSVPDLSVRSGVNLSALYRIENGTTTRPYMRTIVQLAKSLRVEVTDLLDRAA